MFRLSQVYTHLFWIDVEAAQRGIDFKLGAWWVSASIDMLTRPFS